MDNNKEPGVHHLLLLPEGWLCRNTEEESGEKYRAPART